MNAREERSESRVVEREERFLGRDKREGRGRERREER